MDENIIEQFKENLKAPKSVQTDSGKVEQHSINEQINALKYLKRQQEENEEKSPLARVGFYRKVNLD